MEYVIILFFFYQIQQTSNIDLKRRGAVYFMKEHWNRVLTVKPDSRYFADKQVTPRNTRENTTVNTQLHLVLEFEYN